jgi:hypothetical protein
MAMMLNKINKERFFCLFLFLSEVSDLIPAPHYFLDQTLFPIRHSLVNGGDSPLGMYNLEKD